MQGKEVGAAGGLNDECGVEPAEEVDGVKLWEWERGEPWAASWAPTDRWLDKSPEEALLRSAAGTASDEPIPVGGPRRGRLPSRQDDVDACFAELAAGDAAPHLK